MQRAAPKLERVDGNGEKRSTRPPCSAQRQNWSGWTETEGNGVPGLHAARSAKTGAGGRKRRETEYPASMQRAAPKLERVDGIEPTLSAWKAEVLPLNYTRTGWSFSGRVRRCQALWPIKHQRPRRVVRGTGPQPGRGWLVWGAERHCLGARAGLGAPKHLGKSREGATGMVFCVGAWGGNLSLGSSNALLFWGLSLPLAR